MDIKNHNLVAIIGPTASGKTAFAARLADRLNGEIISADSRQIYRRMNIGTGKDYQDYEIDNRTIACHLIDIEEPGKQYNVFEYQHDFVKTWTDIISRNKLPVLCGGSGLYIDAVIRHHKYKLISVPINTSLRKQLEVKSLEELAEMLRELKSVHNTTDIDTKKHAVRALEIATFYKENPQIITDIPKLRPLCIGIRYERVEERRRITERLYKRLDEGMMDEVKDLLSSGLTPEQLMYYGLEYKYITLNLTGKMTYEDMVERLNIAIHQFAKRQMTWFRKMEREGVTIYWIDGALLMEQKIQKTLQLLRNN